MKNTKNRFTLRDIKRYLVSQRNRAGIKKAHINDLRNVSSVFKVFLSVGLLLPYLFVSSASALPAPVIDHPVPSLANGGFSTLATGPDGKLWFAGSHGIGSMTAAGVVTAEYQNTTGSSNFAMDSGGNMWYLGIDPATDQRAIDRMTPAGAVTGYPLPSQYFNVDSPLTIGPDGSLWFSADEYDANTGNQVYEIAKMTPTGTISTYTLPSGLFSANFPMTIAQGSLWFAAYNQSGTTGSIENITTNGAITSYALPSGVTADYVTTGSDGNVWFGVNDTAGNGSIDSMTADGAITSYTLPSDTQANSLATGPDGKLWFDGGAGRIDELQTAVSSVLVQAINVGSNTTVDDYDADTDFSGGATYTSSAAVDTSNVATPAPQAVYQSSRYGSSFSYILPGLTPGDTYTLMLQFNEPFWGVGNNGGGPGSRVFNVAVNGTNVLSNFDIYKTAGGANKAVAEEIPVAADSNGKVTIQFGTVKDNAIVSGIQLFNGTLPPQTPLSPYTFSNLISAGSSAIGNFAADYDFSGGTPYSASVTVDTSGVINPAPESVYQSSRYGSSFSYTIPDLTPGATYNVQLDFNELFFGVGSNGGGIGSRVFNVGINGTNVLSNFDIYKTAGGANKAVAKDFTATADTNGKVTIQFTGVTNNAMVSGVEVTPGS
jgi:streptogramin lyase